MAQKSITLGRTASLWYNVGAMITASPKLGSTRGWWYAWRFS